MGAALIRILALLGLLALPCGARAEGEATADERVVRIVYLGKAYPEPLPIRRR